MVDGLRAGRWPLVSDGQAGRVSGMDIGISGWIVAALCVLITGISKAGLGGALGGLAVPVMSIWLAPRDAVAVVLPILIATDLVGIRAWKGKADWADLKLLLPGAVIGIAAGSLAFGLMSDALVKATVGLIAVAFAADRVFRAKNKKPAGAGGVAGWFGTLCGAVSGFTSTLAHAGGPPVMIYLLKRQLPRETFVATSVYFFTVINLAKLPFYLGLGVFHRETLLMSAALIPLVPLGVWAGLRVLAWIPERIFFAVATLALGLSGAKLLWDGLF